MTRAQQILRLVEEVEMSSTQQQWQQKTQDKIAQRRAPKQKTQTVKHINQPSQQQGTGNVSRT
jgi:hypothetical protein